MEFDSAYIQHQCVNQNRELESKFTNEADKEKWNKDVQHMYRDVK
jgi:hypothetical protein